MSKLLIGSDEVIQGETPDIMSIEGPLKLEMVCLSVRLRTSASIGYSIG